MNKVQASGNATARNPLKLLVTPLSDEIGAEIDGVDIKQVDQAMHKQIKDALGRHHLLVFHGQHLEPDDIEVFAKMFGQVEQHVFRAADGKVLGAVHRVSNLDANNKPSVNPYLNANYFWHSDKAYMPQPSWITMLYGVEIPPVGGDTQFANMAYAYETLPEETKKRIADLRVINSFDYMLETTGLHRRSEEDKKKTPPIEHPLVRVHPDTGRKSLFVTMYAQEIVGMPTEQARALIKELLDHATREENVFTFKWRQNDLVFWDNRSLNHRALANYDMNLHRRVLQRIVIRGQA